MSWANTSLREHPSRGPDKPGGRVADCAGGVRDGHEALADQTIHRRRDGASIARCVPIPLLERESRIAACKALSLGHSEGDVAAGQVAGIALTEARCPHV